MINFALCLLQNRRSEGMIEWVTSNIALPDNSSYLPEVHVQNDHNVAVHSDQTGCPPSALKPFVTPETIVMLPSVMYYYTHKRILV